MSQKVEELEVFKLQNEENFKNLSSLYSAGEIDENGSIVNKNDKQDDMN